MLVVFHVCHAVLSVSCLWGRADLLALLCVIFSCILSLSHIVLGQAGGQAWYLMYRFPIVAFFPILTHKQLSHGGPS